MTSSVHRIGDGDGRSVNKLYLSVLYRLTRCPKVGHAHVYNEQSTRKHYPNHNFATPSAFNIAGGMAHTTTALSLPNMLTFSSPAWFSIRFAPL